MGVYNRFSYYLDVLPVMYPLPIGILKRMDSFFAEKIIGESMEKRVKIVARC